MKTHQRFRFPGSQISRFSKAMGCALAASLFFVANMMGQLASTQDDKAAPVVKQEALLAEVMEAMPYRGESPVPAVASKANGEVAAETIRLVPFVVVGDKRVKLTDAELLTRKAFAADIFKRYDHSAFSLFQHKEDVRLEEMSALKNYSDNLMLAGDATESRAIRKESSRLFLRPHDPETEYIDTAFNPRSR